MPQFSPMSWVLISFLVVFIILVFCVSIWWSSFGVYKFGFFRGEESVGVLRSLGWGWGSRS
uniref:ATP synthase F0 subunit 8 n=1 Tax=Pilsbryoconcha exilis TaxID=178825 RepID=A0A513X0I6_9BIVA|nr:ATP synthase F0 subunit 8 [Pilsbryoconcha exilis]